jgi:peptide/nickel transport system permease protein
LSGGSDGRDVGGGRAASENGAVTLRRYLLVRTGWAAGALFAFVSIAYLVVWVAGDFRHDPGYGSFLWSALTGSLGETASPPQQGASVNSIVWHASGVTLSLLLVTAVFTAVLALLLALLARHSRTARTSVRAFEFLGASLLPIWSGLYIAFYLGFKAHLLHTGGYCPLVSAPAGQCHGPAQWLSHLVWPALTLTIFYGAVYTRIVRHDLAQSGRERRRRVEEGEDAEFVRRDVRRFYAGVYVKRLGRDLGFGLGFALFVETIFSLPGLGQTLVVASFLESGQLMAGVLVWASAIAAVASLLADALAAVLAQSVRRF